jgi:competence protein ComEC
MSHKLLYSKNKWLSPFKISLIAQLFSLPITANFDFSFNFLSVFLSPVLGLYYTYIIFPVSIFLTFFKKSEVFLKYFIIFFEELIFLFNKITILDYNIGYFSVLRTCFYYFCLYHILKNLEVKKKIKQISFIFLLVMLFYHKFSIIDEVTYIDVGQGDSALIKSDSNNCTAIIDTGGIGDFSSSTYHPGERNVVPYLKSMQMSTLDYLFISHSDEDHAGDYKYIIDQINVKNIVLNKFDTSDLGNEIKKVASENGINVIEIQAYHKVRCGEIEINVLNPFNDSNTGNDNSLVLFFVFNGDHFLFTGDIGQSIEEELINDYQLNVDYLKISHHV